MKDETRTATFSSSQIWKLMTNDKKGGFGAPAKKYIKQVQYETLLGRSINSETNARPASWGTMLESRVFELLGIEYQLVSRERLVNPDCKHHTGMPDIITESKVGDIKCPFSLEVFCDKIAALQNIEVYKDEFPEDYWQLVSGSILTGKNTAEAIIYVPYKSELQEIRDMAANYDSEYQNKVEWITWAFDRDLPYLIEGGFYKNLNIFAFEVPQSDKDLLTARVLEAAKLLKV